MTTMSACAFFWSLAWAVARGLTPPGKEDFGVFSGYCRKDYQLKPK
jgi:hypothetical protein